MSESSGLDFNELARSAQRMQGDMAGIQADMGKLQATGFGAGGLVRATVSGEGRVVELSIDPSIINPDDPETLAETVIAAIDSANQALATQRMERIGEFTEGISGLIEKLNQKPAAGGGVVPQFPSRRAPGRTQQPGGGTA
ncbi:MAG: nucleoid-associated protein EbfC [Streptomyces sp.]|jgi:DNA-binding YbaB/EbfC family protein|nr:nucleoid-associated protein EbfC [Streptomyces sp.]